MVELWATCGRMDTPFPPVSVQAWIGSCSRTEGAETETALVVYRGDGRGLGTSGREEVRCCLSLSLLRRRLSTVERLVMHASPYR